jgi:hypothetical protein
MQPGVTTEYRDMPVGLAEVQGLLGNLAAGRLVLRQSIF